MNQKPMNQKPMNQKPMNQKPMNHKLTHPVFRTAALLAMGLAFALPAQATTVNVPEPNSLTLIGAAAMSAILLARYLKKK